MKAILILVVACFFNEFVNAQNIKPFIAVLQTSNGKQKGILQQVDSNSVILNSNGSLIVVPVPTIKSAKLRSVKKDFSVINLIKIGNDTQEYKPDASGRLVDKWGKEAPTLGEELGVTFYSIIGTAIVNGFALPLHSINPNIAKFNFKKNSIRSRPEKLEELSYYSIYYQANPNTLAELKKIKEISRQFKP